MNKNTVKYTNNPELGKLVVIKDFLPSPKELAKAEEVVKVTISLSSKSVDFFKRTATKYNTPYQRIIRKLLDEYVVQQQ